MSVQRHKTLAANTRHKLVQYDWLMHIYITPVKLHTFDSNNLDTCIKCNQRRGTLVHCLYEFWGEINTAVAEILFLKLPVELPPDIQSTVNKPP